MATTLKQYFPILKERETLLAKIQSKSELRELFEEWTEEQQREFLDFCTGVYTGEIGRVFVIDFRKNGEDSGNTAQ